MNLRPGQIAILAAGVVLLIFSFFDFYTVDSEPGSAAYCNDRGSVPAQYRSQLDAACDALDGISAWNTDVAFPIVTLPVILGVVAAGLTAAVVFAKFKVPDVLDFTPAQLMVALAFPGALIMLGFLFMGTESGQGWGLGFWFLLLGSLALLAGAVMELLQGPANPATTGGFGGTQGFGGPPQGPPPGGGYPPQGPPPGPPPGGGFPPQGPPPGGGGSF